VKHSLGTAMAQNASSVSTYAAVPAAPYFLTSSMVILPYVDGSITSNSLLSSSADACFSSTGFAALHLIVDACLPRDANAVAVASTPAKTDMLAV